MDQLSSSWLAFGYDVFILAAFSPILLWSSSNALLAADLNETS
jgi:hypothetical protein